MEVVVTQENLDFAVTSTSRVASGKAGLPILNNVLLRTDGSRLVVAATNLELSTQHYIGAKVVKPGSITVPAKLLSDFIHNLSKDKVTLSVKNNKLHLKTSSTSSTINGTSDEEFPELPVMEDADAISYSITADDFKHAVSQTAGAASGDATRPVLTGVFWHSFEGSLYLAATDGYRLAERTIVKTKSDIQSIIPVSSLQEVLRTLRDDMSEIDILFSDTQATFRLGDAEITSRLIDGTFPDYRQLIPNTSETTAEVSRVDFVRTIKIASLFARETGGGITIEADTASGKLIVNSIASEVGENSSELPSAVNGQSASVSLNSRYLIDALSAMSSDKVTFAFSGKLAPCVLHESVKTPNYKHIVMPLKS